MTTGIFTQFGAEVSQKDIDYWCSSCQFPREDGKCKQTASIRACWSYASAGQWHLAHECPFVHIGQKCRCNDFKKRGDAFKECGLTYHEKAIK